MYAMKWVSAVLMGLLSAGPVLAFNEFNGQVSVVVGDADEDGVPWLSGGLGRLGGLDGSGGLASVDLGWTYHGGSWRARIHGVGRLEPDTRQGRDLGLTEAVVEWRLGQDAAWTLQAGQFFLPTSQENIQDLWSSPYTLTFSAWNSWVGEEIRPIGLDLARSWEHGAVRWTLAGTLFGGNDTAGALLAWRGWSFGRRLSVTGETLPLPDLVSLAPGGSFADQDPRGSAAPGRDLDHRPGYSARVRRTGPSSLLQLTHYDNRGDRDLHRGNYAWDTHYTHVGGEWLFGEHWVLAGEWASGRTTMGLAPGAQVDVDFQAGYLLASYRAEQWRASMRYEVFESQDLDTTLDDPNADDGDAWTLALLYEPSDRWRLGLELLWADGDRLRVLTRGVVEPGSSRQLLLEARYRFGR